ncbi:MAG: hypothetical protein ACI85K_002646 [Hyphomicrobiaceae bacterium]
MSEDDTSERDGAAEFAAAGQAKERGLFGKLVSFMAETRSWWVLPLLIAVALLGLILMLGATGVAPFIYSHFG